MTEDELEPFFFETLKKILSELKSGLEYIKDESGEEYDEIREDYVRSIKDLTEISESTSTFDALAEMDDEKIDTVFDCLEGYFDNFVISSDPVRHEKDMEEYQKLEILMDMFFDDEEDDYDDDDFDGDEEESEN